MDTWEEDLRWKKTKEPPEDQGREGRHQRHQCHLTNHNRISSWNYRAMTYLLHRYNPAVPHWQWQCDDDVTSQTACLRNEKDHKSGTSELGWFVWWQKRYRRIMRKWNKKDFLRGRHTPHDLPPPPPPQEKKESNAALSSFLFFHFFNLNKYCDENRCWVLKR